MSNWHSVASVGMERGDRGEQEGGAMVCEACSASAATGKQIATFRRVSVFTIATLFVLVMPCLASATVVRENHIYSTAKRNVLNGKGRSRLNGGGFVGSALDRSPSKSSRKRRTLYTSSTNESSSPVCQDMTCDELQEAWIWPGKMPPCPGHKKDYSYEDDSCSAWDTSSKGGSKSGGGKGGRSGWSGWKASGLRLR